MKIKSNFGVFWKGLTGLAIAFLISLASLATQPFPVAAVSPPSPSRAEVCEIVATMPNGDDPDGMLQLLRTSREQIITDLNAMKRNMEQYDAEGYGWQNVIDDPAALEPKPTSWLIGALGMACEPQPATAVTGTVTYPQRIALPPEAVVVVKLEDVSLADAPAVVIAERTIPTNGQQVPIPFKLVYDPGDIIPNHRYTVSARILHGGNCGGSAPRHIPSSPRIIPPMLRSEFSRYSTARHRYSLSINRECSHLRLG